jgi:hypothetical protein
MLTDPDPTMVTRPVASTVATLGQSPPHTPPVTALVLPSDIVIVAVNVSDVPMYSISELEVTIMVCAVGVGVVGVFLHAANKRQMARLIKTIRFMVPSLNNFSHPYNLPTSDLVIFASRAAAQGAFADPKKARGVNIWPVLAPDPS